MRRPLAALLLLLSGCVAPGGTPPAPAPAVGEASLSLDLFPFRAASAAFVNVTDSAPRTVRVEPGVDGATARILIGPPGGRLQEILRVTRRGDSLLFAEGAAEGTELLRAGARTGESWESGGWRVRFDGWERVTIPNAGVDAARITARRGPDSLERIETWWFAKDVGLVRLRSDHGTLFVDELIRTGNPAE